MTQFKQMFKFSIFVHCTLYDYCGRLKPTNDGQTNGGCQLFKSRVKQISLLVLQTETP